MKNEGGIVVVTVLFFVGLSFTLTTAENPTSNIIATKFSCRGRPSGYYADVEMGCQVYHMCDDLGRQFSYECPNTTLFQQRMLVCDHWYMVNCSKAEGDYHANLLIGQRDKPFVTDYENHQRTPRPDILSVPLTPDFFKNLKDYKLQYPISGHVSNSISSGDETDTNNNDDLNENRYNIPTKWSMGHSDLHKSYTTTTIRTTTKNYNLNTASSTYPKNTFATKKPTNNKIPPNNIELSHAGETGHKTRSETVRDTHSHSQSHSQANGHQKPAIPTHQSAKIRHHEPHSQQLSTSTSTEKTITKFHNKDIKTSTTQKPKAGHSAEDLIDIKFGHLQKDDEPSVVKFINQFIPNDDYKTTVRSIDEIKSINSELPNGQISKEDFPENATQTTTHAPKLEHHHKANETQQSNRRNFDVHNMFDTHNENGLHVKSPSRVFLPPKQASSVPPSATRGPPIYYEWKWAVPAFDLEPPKEASETSNKTKSPPTPTHKHSDPTEPPLEAATQRALASKQAPGAFTAYRPSDYFIPKFVFPLDKAHPGYEDNDSYTSFQVKIPHEEVNNKEKLPNYGENSLCPQCHPAFVVPGTCKPCVMIRQ